ncbi:N-acetylmuramoyl-L-alanine amidase CwlD [Paenibacillus macquariensis]|uniref:N-acetylmuramoyl-L-alanine amidase n=1 Tax=Paenibacillus macquariensis TaxID=948756 RepID=A0ABY1KCU2_9BACL|nr:N-acetylmuramoyl-L-alanine amidase CwlD [Paenibacillus macquariensis]MEC0093954.1 N-acetylmuramoyl-L-alanine amidase CwlD [Paenibacillus macquariensis]OAB28761.1 N-acetylmuramoyl-L-alanine amidase CwlD [Paenibacillus macquariensis subsp. macquariensis]SIR62066.1 N-acetylmuramoyl-L-alanine amidase [Paenibacillus macquariensis]
MSKPKSGAITIWIRLRTIKKLLVGVCLLIVFVGIVTYEVPTERATKYWSLPLAGKVIVLDAGHGGVDGGAVSRQGVIEKDINLAITLYLRDYLQEAGAVVKMTREGDYDLASPDTKGYSKRKSEDLKQRVKKIEEQQPYLFLSVHMNSIPSNLWRGAQVFYYPNHPDNANLATLMQDEMKRNLENTDRIAKTVNTVYLLRTLKIPAALVEVGFLSNAEEAMLLRDVEYQRKVAASIYKGILRYSSGEKSKVSSE